MTRKVVGSVTQKPLKTTGVRGVSRSSVRTIKLSSDDTEQKTITKKTIKKKRGRRKKK
jgi:hypothetical protein